MSDDHKRRNFFIKKDFQGKLILGYFLFVTGGCLLFIFLLGAFSADTMTIAYDNYDIKMGQTPVMLLKNAIAAHWIFIVIGGSLLVLAAMLITHRIAGPLYRFEQVLDKMVAGNLTDIIHLRTKDNGKALAHKINTFNQGLSEHLAQINLQVQEIENILSQYGEKESISQQELEELRTALQEKNNLIKEISGSYTLAND